MIFDRATHVQMCLIRQAPDLCSLAQTDCGCGGGVAPCITTPCDPLPRRARPRTAAAAGVAPCSSAFLIACLSFFLVWSQGLARSTGRMSSYYNNGPRIFTPAALNTQKTFLPVESFTSHGNSLPPPPENINTCHQSRGRSLQHTHPSKHHLASNARRLMHLTRPPTTKPRRTAVAGTYAMLRQVEHKKTTDAATSR